MHRRFRFFLILLFLLLWGVGARALNFPPAIFLNDLPNQSIVVRPGERPTIPIFVVSGVLEGKPLEFFVWREWADPPVGVSGAKEYLGEDLSWQPFADPGEMKPVGKSPLPSYLLLNWSSEVFLSPFDWTENLPPDGATYTLFICLDAVVDDAPPPPEEFSADPPQAACASVPVTFISGRAESTELCVPTSVSADLPRELSVEFFSGFAPFFIYPLRSDCNLPPTCQVERKPSWLEVSFEDSNLRLDFSSSLSPGSYQGELVITCEVASGQQRLEVPVRVKVDPVPGSCGGTLFLRDAGGREYASGATIYLSSSRSFEVVCRQKILGIIDGDTVLKAFAFAVDSAAVEASNQAGTLLLIPREEEAEAHLRIGVGEKRLQYTVRTTGKDTSCTPEVTPTSLSFTSSGTKTVSVRDTCGRSLAYRVSEVSGAWITAPRVGATGTGSLSVTVNATGLAAGTYSGRIKLVPEGGAPVTISVVLNVSAPSNTLILWPPEINASLEAGEKTEETISATCSGQVPSSCSAAKVSGGDWLTVSGCNGALVTLAIDATGLTSGQTYTGSVSITTSCGSKIVPVTLNVTGVCEPTSVSLSQSTVSVATVVGSSPASQTISVTDNCGAPLSIDITGVTYTPSTASGWLSYTVSDGSLTLSFSTASLAVGTYEAAISFETPLGSASVTVTLTVSDVPPAPPVATVTLTNGQVYSTTFDAGEAILFSFNAAASTGIPLSVTVSVPSGNSFGYLNMLLVNAGADCTAADPPTVTQIQDLITQWENGLIGSTGQSGNTYWYLGGALVKNLLIYEDIPTSCWYLLVYNSSNTSYSSATVSFTAP